VKYNCSIRTRLKTWLWAKGTGFTDCGKTRSGGRRGFQPPHKGKRTNAGFSPGGTLFADFARILEFFRGLLGSSGWMPTCCAAFSRLTTDWGLWESCRGAGSTILRRFRRGGLERYVWDSGGGWRGLPDLRLPVHADGLQFEGVLSRWDHGHRNRGSIQIGVAVLGLQPRAQPGIVNLRLVLPETGLQSALNLEMIQLQLDARNLFREITPNVPGANVEPGDSASLALRFDHHTHLPFNVGRGQSRDPGG